MAIKEQVLLISASVLYSRKGDDVLWFLIKENDKDGWEIAKTIVRNGESSVRGAIRSMGEQGGMRVKVLEEVGRHGGAAKVNGKVITQRIIYYLIVHKEGNEVLGFKETDWFEYSTALRKLTTKRDKEMLKAAKALLKEIRDKKKKKKKALTASLK